MYEQLVVGLIDSHCLLMTDFLFLLPSCIPHCTPRELLGNVRSKSGQQKKNQSPELWKSQVQTKIDYCDTVKRNSLVYVFWFIVKGSVVTVVAI